jgi:hypothetical protein
MLVLVQILVWSACGMLVYLDVPGLTRQIGNLTVAHLRPFETEGRVLLTEIHSSLILNSWKAL